MKIDNLREALEEILSIGVMSPEGGHEAIAEIHRIARAALAAPSAEPVAPAAYANIDALTMRALESPHLNKLREWASIGPVQRADVQALVMEALRLATPAQPPAAERVECDCQTAISPDGARITTCGSAQMRRAVSEGHAFVRFARRGTDPTICSKRSAEASGPVRCGDWGAFCDDCPAAATAQPVKHPPCKGLNCGSETGRGHSAECEAEHAAAIAGGKFVSAAEEQCSTCGQTDVGQHGEYRCQTCGLPRTWDLAAEPMLNGLTAAETSASILSQLATPAQPPAAQHTAQSRLSDELSDLYSMGFSDGSKQADDPETNEQRRAAAINLVLGRLTAAAPSVEAEPVPGQAAAGEMPPADVRRLALLEDQSHEGLLRQAAKALSGHDLAPRLRWAADNERERHKLRSCMAAPVSGDPPGHHPV